MGTEAYYQSSVWDGYDEYYNSYSTEEAIAEMEWERANTLCILSGRKVINIGHQHKPHSSKNINKFVIVQDNRKDDKNLLLVDRRKSKDYWWTHDLSIALTGTKEEMNKVLKNLQYNNPRVISINQYLNG